MCFGVYVFLLATLSVIYPGVCLRCYKCTTKESDNCATNKTLKFFDMDCSLKQVKESLKDLNKLFPPVAENHSLFDPEIIEGLKETGDSYICVLLLAADGDKEYTIRDCLVRKFDDNNTCTHMTRQMPYASSSYSVVDCAFCDDRNLCNTSMVFSPSIPYLLITLSAIFFNCLKLSFIYD